MRSIILLHRNNVCFFVGREKNIQAKLTDKLGHCQKQEYTCINSLPAMDAHERPLQTSFVVL
jgi:hypothetical protein